MQLTLRLRMSVLVVIVYYLSRQQLNDTNVSEENVEQWANAAEEESHDTEPPKEG